MKAYLLARVSSKEQEDNNSIPAQTRNLLEYSKKHDLDVIDIYQLVESSTKTNRKQFNELIDKINNSIETVALVTDTVDRLQRSFKESVILDEIRKAGKVELHFVRENLIITQNSNSSEILRWDIAVMFAKSYVTQLSDNVKRSTELKRKNGEWSGLAPFGYKNVTKADGQKWIVPDDKTSNIVIEMYKWYASYSYSLKGIKNRLKKEYNIEMPTSSIDRVLKRTFYYGVMTIKNEIYPHNYDPLITKDLLDKVQNRKSEANKKPFKYAGKEYYYRGLIRCAKCGYSVTPEMSKGHVYYHCTQYGGKHNAEWIREEDLTEQIMEAFYLIQPNEEQFNQVKDSLQASRADKNKYKAYHLNLLQTTLTKTEKRLDSLQEKYIDGDIEKEYYKQSLVKYKAEQKEIKSKINAVDKADDEFYSNIEQIMELVRNAPSLLEKADIEKKRILINYALQNLELDGRQLRWKYKKPFNLMASCNKTSNWLELGHGNITINDNSLDFDISEIDSIYDDSAEDK